MEKKGFPYRICDLFFNENVLNLHCDLYIFVIYLHCEIYYLVIYFYCDLLSCDLLFFFDPWKYTLTFTL